MTIFENIKQMFNHLKTTEEINYVRNMLIIREQEIKDE